MFISLSPICSDTRMRICAFRLCIDETTANILALLKVFICVDVRLCIYTCTSLCLCGCVCVWMDVHSHYGISVTMCGYELQICQRCVGTVLEIFRVCEARGCRMGGAGM